MPWFNFRLSNTEVFSGTQPNWLFQLDKSSSVLQQMIEHIRNSERNVTVNNWFSSVPLVNQLVRDENLTDIRENKTEILPQWGNTRSIPMYSNVFTFWKEGMLVLYDRKKYSTWFLFQVCMILIKLEENIGYLCKLMLLIFY